eukprot:4582432-Pyramimonas_sp.AAC.1
MARAFQLPWLIVGDLNIPAAALAKTGFASSIGGRVYTGDLVAACAAGPAGSSLDDAIASGTCFPCLVSNTPVARVPWKDHIG